MCTCIYIYMHMNIRSMLPYIIHVLTQHQQKQSWSAAVTHDGADGHRKVNHFLPRGIPGDPRGIPGGSQGDPRGHHWKRICCRRNCGSNQSRNLWGFEPNLPHSEPVFLGHFTNNHGVKYQPMPG